MILVGVFSPSAALRTPTNIVGVHCDCGVFFAWPSHISLATCPGCNRQDLWHAVDPRPESGPWSEPVMRASA